MIKRDEISNPNSCLNKSADDEPVFVLRAHDPHASNIVRTWANVRITAIVCRQKPESDMEIVRDALALADTMDAWHEAEKAKDAG